MLNSRDLITARAPTSVVCSVVWVRSALERFQLVHRLFAVCGLPVPEAAPLGPALQWSDGLVEPRLIVVKRYDRVAESDVETAADRTTLPPVTRLHQEDLCQITGRRPSAKYQANGGPTFRDLASVIRRYAVSPEIDLENAIKVAIANICVGNGDAHGKNFSLLVDANGHHRLAPFYDIVSTNVYPLLTPTFSMRFGYADRASELSGRDLVRVAKDFGVTVPLVRRALESITTTLQAALDGVLHEVEREVGIETPVLARIRALVVARVAGMRAVLV